MSFDGFVSGPDHDMFWLIGFSFHRAHAVL
jgi:hypothetical protein